MDSDSFPLSKKEKAYISCAKSLAELSDHRCKIGCVIVDQHRIISSGHNSSTKVHTIQDRLNKKFFGDCPGCPATVHAEIEALIPLIKHKTDLSRATLYTYREDKHGKLTKSRPCPRCMHEIKKLGIKRIVYSTEMGICKERII